VSLSTAEAEYVALSSAAQEAIWLRGLCKDLQYESLGPTIIFEDNQAAMKMANNSCFHGRQSIYIFDTTIFEKITKCNFSIAEVKK
jgi:hypothetical protein